MQKPKMGDIVGPKLKEGGSCGPKLKKGGDCWSKVERRGEIVGLKSKAGGGEVGGGGLSVQIRGSLLVESVKW